MTTDELRDILHAKYPAMDVQPIRQENLVFEQRVRLKCFQCRNYRAKWTCPGNLPAIDFPKLIAEYEHLAVIIGGESPQADYRQAGNELHRAMLYLESELMRSNNALAQSFIGGSCELCADGCPSDACAHPDQARIPWDAAGCNVTRSLANIGIRLNFTAPTLHRYGLFLW